MGAEIVHTNLKEKKSSHKIEELKEFQLIE